MSTPALPQCFGKDLEAMSFAQNYHRWILSEIRKGNLLDLIEQTGFEPIKSCYFDFAGILPWYVNFALFGNSINGGSVSLYDKLVVLVPRVLEGIVRPPLGKNLLVVGRKR